MCTKHKCEKRPDSLTVIFVGEKYGHCADIYKVLVSGELLIRQQDSKDIVKWTTATKIYEADCPLKDGLTLNIIDIHSKLIFSETTYSTEWNDHGQADKKYPFSWESEAVEGNVNYALVCDNPCYAV